MAHEIGDRDELLRKFEAAISGLELDDLRHLSTELAAAGGPLFVRPERPRLRRPRLDRLALYRVRVDLDHAHPPIWRRLEVRSDVTLDAVHQVIQAAFGWSDSHLHRFALGGSPFDPQSEVFLCPYDVEEGEDDGAPVADVRLDETLQEPRDVLRYAYDYGDSWELTLRLEEVLPASPDTPTATCTDGRRAAPPEDCGGITDAAQLAEVLDDPAYFDLAEVNRALRDPLIVVGEYGFDPRLIRLATQLRGTEVGEDLAVRMAALGPEPASALNAAQRSAALRAHLWFLDRAGGEGIELTGAGYLKPVDVVAASEVVPAMGDWIGMRNREVHAGPVLSFRQSLQTLGLLRKHKGRLLLTRAGALCRDRPELLWQHLADRLIRGKADSFELHASLLVACYAATETDRRLPRERILTALAALGWRDENGNPPSHVPLWGDADTFSILLNVSHRVVRTGPDRDRLSPAAAALARSALLVGRR